MKNLISKLEGLVINFLLFLIKVYKIFLSPYLGQNCRYHPTCSSYAQESLKIHGLRKGLILSIIRISKCHPLGGGGVDLVPEKEDLKN